ncbi:cytochrome c oxidase subunit IIa family protein [Chitinophaga skermanii]|uniref:Cytochrome c oxidase subunit IIa family protein n=1 Tax=Chitinophaga skermanii TaxID=331697 RepID=A0A327R4H5_9BACT|nr:cytochrome c oxidase subunit 2A [Chitinophaga skermanii]RAJ10958.1 cytochrome c oxidase subunit IIa family protein [Chitinophaga skermanii]
MPGQHDTEEKFIPKGAIAFFMLLITLCVVIWYGIYYIMLERA